MTKKEFKSKCSFHEYGRGLNKRNAIYFDRQLYGFKFMVKANVAFIKKQDLFNMFYDWVTEKIQQPDHYVQYKYAETDEQRFKVSLMG